MVFGYQERDKNSDSDRDSIDSNCSNGKENGVRGHVPSVLKKSVASDRNVCGAVDIVHVVDSC